MVCDHCYGKRLVLRLGKVEPCAECGGMGVLHCCDGLQEQPILDDPLEVCLRESAVRTSRRLCRQSR